MNTFKTSGVDHTPLQCAAGCDTQAKSARTVADSNEPAVTSPLQLAQQRHIAQLRAKPASNNETGLPDQLKTGIETLSGLDLSGVRVHRNSPRPAQLQAHAFAQGQQIHLAPGQEAHLPHEAWHVVQQKQGRVRPTRRLANVSVNDDAGLEREADSMGRRAVLQGAHMDLAALDKGSGSGVMSGATDSSAPVQRSGKGALAGAAVGGGLGAFGFLAGPLVGSITTTVGALIGGIVGHLKTDGPLPRGAFARGDKTLAPVSTSELDSILEHTARTPDEVKAQIKQTGDRLIAQGLLFWTAGTQEHCEVIVDNETGDTYRVRVIVVIPRRATREQQDVDMQRGAAVHELVHAIEVVSRIGGIENLGKDIPKVTESNNVLRGNQLQWSKVPADETTLMVKTLKGQLTALINAELDKGIKKNSIAFAWSYYEPRIDYAIANRHEVPTVINQLIDDIHSLGDQDILVNTDFYRTLIKCRRRLFDAL